MAPLGLCSLVALRWYLNLFPVGVVLVLSCQLVTQLWLCLPHGVGTLGSQARKASGLSPTWALGGEGETH